MISVVIIGYGNVGYHLTNVFINAKNVTVNQVYNRTIHKINHLANLVAITDNLDDLKEADVYIIAVSDDFIGSISSKITNKNAFVVHTSGSVFIENLKNAGRKGVFYMLQSFSKDKTVDFSKIPFCLEAQSNEDFKILEQLAISIGEKIYQIDSLQRSKLHVAAVYVNNFVNHMYKIGNDICQENNIPFEILHPLIQETTLKITHLSPKEAQTGPAKRNDPQTIKKHLAIINKEQKEIYKLLTKSIFNNG